MRQLLPLQAKESEPEPGTFRRTCVSISQTGLSVCGQLYAIKPSCGTTLLQSREDEGIGLIKRKKNL